MTLPGDEERRDGVPGDEERRDGVPGDEERRDGVPGDEERRDGVPGEEPGNGVRGSLAPFAGAFAVFAFVVIGITVFTLTRGDGLTETQRVGLAVVGQNDALQRQSYVDYQKYTCAQQQGTEANFIAAQQESTRQRGARYVDNVTDVKIDGDRATGTVGYHFEKDPNGKLTSPLTFARQDGQWKVCSAYR